MQSHTVVIVCTFIQPEFSSSHNSPHNNMKQSWSSLTWTITIKEWSHEIKLQLPKEFPEFLITTYNQPHYERSINLIPET